MSPSPSDEWLLAILDEKSPEELTPAELAALRERARVSPAVRQAIAEHIRLESVLHARFAEPAVTAEAVVRRAGAGRRRLAGFGLIAVLLAAGVGAAWWLSGKAGQGPAGKGTDRTVAAREGERAASETARQAEGPRSDTRPATAPVEASRPKAAPAATAAASVDPPSRPQRDEGPWSAALADDARVVPFEESAFASFGGSVPGFEPADEFPKAELESWLAAVPNKPFGLNEGQWRGGRKFSGLEGIAKLRAPWRSDAVLRLAPFDVAEFALQIWNGNEGYLIRYYPHVRPQILTAYAATRDAADPTTAKGLRLAATDGGRFGRANAGAIELRHQDGRLVLTRGAVPLLVVPMATPPAEIYFDARTRFRALAMYRGGPAPLPPGAPRRELLPAAADEAEWVVAPDPAPQVTKGEGNVTLATDGKAMPWPRRAAWAGVRLPKDAGTGLCEAVFRIEDLTPGTGLYLGDGDGRPVHTLFAGENTPTGRPILAYGWTSRDGNTPDPRWRWDSDPKNEIVPSVGRGSWVKVVVGPGGLKTFLSADGRHWGSGAVTPERAVRGTFESVGVFATADDKPRSISVSAVSVRELSGITALAGADLRRRVPVFETAPERPSDWIAWATTTRPEDVPLDAWLRACGVETLARGVNDAVSGAVLDGLLRDAAESDRPSSEVVALLHDAALLADLWDGRARRFAEHYERIARRIARRGNDSNAVATDLAVVAAGYVASPIWTETRPWSVPPAVVRDVAAAAAWATAAGGPDSARQVAAYLTPAHPDGQWATEEEAGLARLAAWGSEVASSRPETFDASARFAWRHPLATEPGREGTTIAQELEAALEVGAYEDAARLVAALAGSQGLVPAPGDPDRYLPPAGLVAESARQRPDLVKVLGEKFGPAGLIAVRQSEINGDEAAVREAAVRFFGTPAAAEAHRWLGDSALSDGRFAEAASHFAAAATAASAEQQADLAARRRLAAALAGEEATGPPTGPVAFGPQTLDPAAFESLVGDLRKARAAAAAVAPDASIPEPVPVKAEARGRFEGDAGQNPGRGEFRRFDWAGRQIAVTLEGGVAYLSNRFQVAAFDLGRRAANWAVGLGGEQGQAHAMPNVAFRPVASGNRLYLRRLTGRAPELACLATNEGGKLLWRSEAGLTFASDLVFDGGSLVAVTYRSDGRIDSDFILSLTRIRPEDGAVIATRPILTLNQVGEQRPYATLSGVGDGFVVTTWGAACRCGADGELAWVRRLPYLPAPADPDFDRLAPDPPLVVGDRVVFAPPGGRAAIGLEAATGRLLWTRPLGELERLFGKAGEIVVVRSGDSLLALDPATGATKWTFRRTGLLDGLICDETTILATAYRKLPAADAVLLPTKGREVVWVEDALPANARPEATGDENASGWRWVGAPDRPVFSGTASAMRQAKGEEVAQHFFTGADPLTIAEGDVFFAYVYLDPAAPPKQVMLQFNDGSWEHRAYWGEGGKIPFGQDGTPGKVRFGELPPAGRWVRLEVPAAQVGLAPGAALNGWAFTQAGGTVYWDKAGVVTTGAAGSPDRREGLVLVRLDPASGAVRSEQVFKAEHKEELRCGPLFVHQGAVWALVGESWNDTKRTLVEFVPDPAGPAVEPSSDLGALGNWLTPP